MATVSLVFFTTGCTVDTGILVENYTKWKHHLFIQVQCFLAVSVLAFAVVRLAALDSTFMDPWASHRVDLQRLPAYRHGLQCPFYPKFWRKRGPDCCRDDHRQSVRTVSKPSTHSAVLALRRLVYPGDTSPGWRIQCFVPESLHAIRPVHLPSLGCGSSHAPLIPQGGEQGLCRMEGYQDQRSLHVGRRLVDV